MKLKHHYRLQMLGLPVIRSCFCSEFFSPILVEFHPSGFGWCCISWGTKWRGVSWGEAESSPYLLKIVKVMHGRYMEYRIRYVYVHIWGDLPRLLRYADYIGIQWLFHRQQLVRRYKTDRSVGSWRDTSHLRLRKAGAFFLRKPGSRKRELSWCAWPCLTRTHARNDKVSPGKAPGSLRAWA